MRRILLLWVFVASGTLAGQPAAHAQALKSAVSLAGSNATNDTMDAQVPAGRMALDLYFYATAALPQSPSPAKLAVTNLRATTAPGDVLSVTARTTDGTASGTDGAAFDVMLTTGEPLRITISAANLRPATTYKTTIFLTAIKETRQWELTLTSGAKGTLVADAIPALQFERSWEHWWCEWRGCQPTPVGEFKFSLRNKTPLGSLTGLHLRFDPGTTAASKTIRSNFALENFVFSAATDPLNQNAALPQPAAPTANPAVTRATNVTSTDGGQASLPGILLDTPRWYQASVSHLKPGEYSGALRFSANEALEDAADSRLALLINVRDPRAIPITVLVFASLVGWFSTKYLVAARKARDMARTVQLLRDRSDDLARGDSTREGWQFTNEATSYALIKVRVTLNRLSALSRSGLRMLFEEAELTHLKDDAEARLTKLEALRDIRLQVQIVANNRPTVQRVVGRLLRAVNALLERSVFDSTQQTAFTARLGEIQPWIPNDTRLQKYREALSARNANDNAGIDPKQAKVVGAHVEAILNNWPALAAINAADATMSTLLPFDEQFETLALLWREQNASWAQELADACSRKATLNELFDVVDKAFWTMLQGMAPHITIVREAARQESVDCYNPIELYLQVPGIDRSRVLIHPLRVVWSIKPPTGPARVVETDDGTLVQHFSSPGKASITAELHWAGQEPIKISNAIELTITKNLDYRWYHLFLQGGILELAALTIAILFATVTAMQSQYDSTFGSTGQYLALFVWAAGAATGGNVLKQLGTSSTPGGQADNALPPKP